MAKRLKILHTSGLRFSIYDKFSRSHTIAFKIFYIFVTDFGDTMDTILSIKGNPVEIRNSARYCDTRVLKSFSHHCPNVSDGKVAFQG